MCGLQLYVEDGKHSRTGFIEYRTRLITMIRCGVLGQVLSFAPQGLLNLINNLARWSHSGHSVFTCLSGCERKTCVFWMNTRRHG